ncbi:MAG: hypothetical protein LAT82_03315 [Nanoarchaeota archaeon]|nr:hypothetical protein [Nanoarchaeota archaeon]
MADNEDRPDLDLMLETFKFYLSKDSKSLEILNRDLFSKYSLFTDNLLVPFSNLISPFIDVPRKTGLENRLVFETICGDLDSSVQLEKGLEPLSYTTTFICSGCVFIGNEKNQIVTATSFSKSSNFDDATLYDDLVGVLYAFNPNVIIDLFRYEYTTRGMQREAELPVRFHQGQILQSEPLLRHGL